MNLGNHRVITAVLAIKLCAFSAHTTHASTLTLPLRTDTIATYLADQNNPTVESFLAALPQSIKQSFVLMHDSRSMQRATPQQPRQILFGADARFLLAVSGVPEDPRFNELEFAEFEPSTGRYHFGTISFAPNGPATIKKDVAFCQNCHGATPHPIWAPYPDWKGAYGNDRGAIEEGLKQDFAAFLTAAPSSPRYQHLSFRKTNDQSTFLLPTRYYPYPNTDFNHELGNTMALGVATRLKAHPSYNRWSAAALATSTSLYCSKSNKWFELAKKINTAYAPIASQYAPTSRLDVKTFRLLGVDPVVELSLEKMAGVPGGGGAWQTGAYRLEEAITFQLLIDTIGRDPALESLLAPEKEPISRIKSRSLLVGEERAKALETSSAWFLFFDVFDPVNKSQTRRDTICGHLISMVP